MSTTAQSLGSFRLGVSQAIQLFRLDLLHTPHGVENALQSLTSIVNLCQGEDRRYFTAFVEGLLSSETGILEYIYAKDSNAARIIRATVLGEQAVNHLITEDQLWCCTLLRLSDFYLRLPPTIDIPNYPKITKAYQTVAKLRQTGLNTLSRKDIDYPVLLKSILKFYLDTLAEIAGSIVSTYEQAPRGPNETSFSYVAPAVFPTTNSASAGDSEENLESDITSTCEYINSHALRAAALFDAGDGKLGPWPMLFSSKGYSHWRQLGTTDAAIFKIVHRKMIELSFGFFSSDNQRLLAGDEKEVPIFTARLTGDRFLIYQIECGFPPSTDIAQVDHNYETQMIRIFGIYSHAKIKRPFWSALARQSRKLGGEYRRRCIRRAVARTTSKGYKVMPPIVFDDVVAPTTDRKDDSSKDGDASFPLSNEDSLLLHSLLALEKYVPYSRHIFDACRNNEELTSVFAVSREEEKIIYHPSSTLVIGRSGTGKTTTMIFKMIALEKAAALSNATLRQMFVTQSPVLAKRVAEFYNKYKEHTTSPITAESFSVLDHVDEVVEAESTLPLRWSDLKDVHFPLFVTFEQLCRLLQADLAPDFGISVFGEARKPITFDIFLRDIWPHFNQQLKKGLDSSLVWSEFMGVIKGSEQSLRTSRGYVDSETYEAMPSTSGLFIARSRVYTLFESYLKQKKARGMYDIPERTHILINSLDSVGLFGGPVDYLYVDEVQDNLLLDVGLLGKLCRSPTGLFWAGDSAQTIAVGSSFRFSELTAYLYRVEMSDYAVKNKIRQPIHPRCFKLLVNYRSQGGIINAAASIVEMISKFFPRSIDYLPKERSKVDGPEPVIFSPILGSQVQLDTFLFGNAQSRVEFGAEQVILVRNEAARDQLVKQIGDLALVLTLYESKGLEFNDVLLYDFFSDSPASAADWRVVLNCIEDEHVSAPRFDELRHASIQSELKFLYVGLTRAQNRVWIWDSSEKIDPMKMFFLSRDLATIASPSGISSTLAVSSTENAWRKRACALFQQKLYRQSTSAFRKAGMRLESLIAEAFYARSEAETMSSGHAGRSSAWESAATKFDDCGELSSAHLLQQKRLRLLAAESYTEVPNHQRAAALFELSADYTKAVIHYRLAGCFDNAIQIIRDHRHRVDLLVAKKTENIAKVFYTKEGDLKKARDLFKSPTEHTRFLDTLGLDHMLAEVLEDMQKYDEAAEIVEKSGDELRAARLHLRSDNAQSGVHAIRSLLGKLWKQFSPDASLCTDSAQVTEVVQMAQSIESINPGDQYEIETFAAIHRSDHRHLEAIIPLLLQEKRRAAGILAMEHVFRLRGYSIRAPRNSDTADYEHLEGAADTTASPLEHIEAIIQLHSSYSNEVRNIVVDIQNSVCDPQVQKLLHFSPLESVVDGSAHEYIVYHLHPPVLQATTYARSFKETSDGVVVNYEDMQRILLRSLSCRYNERIRDLQHLLLGACALQPCPLYAAGCFTCVQKEESKCYRSHVPAKTATATFPIRVRVHLQLITLLDGMMPDYATASSDDMSQTFGKQNMQRVWLERFFECLYPACSALGSLPSLDKGILLANPAWLQTVKTWIKARFFLLRPVEAYFRFYMTSVLNMSLLGFTLDFSACSEYAYRTRCSYYTRWFEPPLLQRETNKTVVRGVLDSLSGVRPNSLHIGVMSLRHIATHPDLPVDVDVLTTYIEHIITFLAFSLGSSRAGQGTMYSLHNIILPRTWVIQGLCRIPFASINARLLTTEILVTGIGDILGRMKQMDQSYPTSISSFVFRGRDLRHMPYGLRSLLRARLCRALVVLGLNCGREIQDSIVRIFRNLNEFRPHELFLKFVRSGSWSELTRALRESSFNGPSDELCHLIFQTGPLRINPVQGLSHILFRNREDLLSQMGLSQTAVSYTLNIQTSSDLSPRGEEAGSIHSPSDQNIGQHHPETETPTTNNSEEVKAYEVIANAYKHHLERQTSSKTGNHFFVTCLARLASGGVGDIRHEYRQLFLGPLPHLLAWLEEAIKTCGRMLKKQSQVLSEASHESYDKAFEMIVRLKPLKKELLNISKRLEPDSSFHHLNTPQRLRGEALMLVLPVRRHVRKLLPRLSTAALEDFRLASVGLSMERLARTGDDSSEEGGI